MFRHDVSTRRYSIIDLARQERILLAIQIPVTSPAARFTELLALSSYQSANLPLPVVIEDSRKTPTFSKQTTQNIDTGKEIPALQRYLTYHFRSLVVVPFRAAPRPNSF